MANHPDLATEQAYLDRAYDRLEAMRRTAEALRDSVIDGGQGGTPQARVERDVFVEASLQRLEQLQLGRSALCFGRIDTDEAESFYIGRLAVSDEDQEPLIVDWRAPVAESFYRATGRHPMGLVRRRHFATEGRTLVGIEDELFAPGGGAHGNGSSPADEIELVGPGALLAALQRSRSGHMRDIVATVQREQDEIIRGALPGVLVVQGGPGTGKTAVALHRAAYLLYTHRFPLEQQGVLVVGPNQVFLRYIDRVLPSLGETGVVLSTLAGLVPDVRARGHEDPDVARLKGDRRMVMVLGRAVADRQRPLRDDFELGIGALIVRVPAGDTAAMVASAKRRPGPHNARRRVVEGLFHRALFEAYGAAVARGQRTGVGGGPAAPEGESLDHDEFVATIRRQPEVVAALDRMWPVLTPEELLHDLFGAPALIRLAGRGVLGARERRLLARPRSASLNDIEWSVSDVALLDEARALLGPLRSRRPRPAERGEAPEDGIRTYGHIVVDEAQDLSPMALRMLARRSISGSMTLVGDLGQATSPLAASSWDDVLSMLPSRRPPRVTNLTVNYRTPAEVMDVALEVLRDAGVSGVDPPRSVRSTGQRPVVRSAPASSLSATVAATAADEARAVDGGTVGVIAPEALLASLSGALDDAGVDWRDPDRDGLGGPVTLLSLLSAKGLEFDSVVVVEPADLVAESPQGVRALFVALTRTTGRLVVVHARPLPVGLARAAGRRSPV